MKQKKSDERPIEKDSVYLIFLDKTDSPYLVHTNFIFILHGQNRAKGQLISKCLCGVIVLTKKQTKSF